MAKFNLQPIDPTNKKTDNFELSKSTYDNALEYYYLVKKFGNPLASANHREFTVVCIDSIIANASFACEQFIKSLLYFFDKDIRGHNLYKLFILLPVDIQEEIKENTPMSNDKPERFYAIVEEIGDAFLFFRYMNEKKEACINILFLITFMCSLETCCYNKIKDILTKK